MKKFKQLQVELKESQNLDEALPAILGVGRALIGPVIQAAKPAIAWGAGLLGITLFTKEVTKGTGESIQRTAIIVAAIAMAGGATAYILAALIRNIDDIILAMGKTRSDKEREKELEKYLREHGMDNPREIAAPSKREILEAERYVKSHYHMLPEQYSIGGYASNPAIGKALSDKAQKRAIKNYLVGQGVIDRDGNILDGGKNKIDWKFATRLRGGREIIDFDNLSDEEKRHIASMTRARLGDAETIPNTRNTRVWPATREVISVSEFRKREKEAKALQDKIDKERRFREKMDTGLYTKIPFVKSLAIETKTLKDFAIGTAITIAIVGPIAALTMIRNYRAKMRRNRIRDKELALMLLAYEMSQAGVDLNRVDQVKLGERDLNNTETVFNKA